MQTRERSFYLVQEDKGANDTHRMVLQVQEEEMKPRSDGLTKCAFCVDGEDCDGCGYTGEVPGEPEDGVIVYGKDNFEGEE